MMSSMLPTPRTASEHAVGAGERLLSAVVESSPDAFVVLDDDSRIQSWNRAAERLFGWTREEATGRSLVDLIVPEELGDVHYQGLRRRAAGHAPRLGADPVQVEAVCRDGRRLLVELTVGELEWEGRRHFHAFMRDVTEREAERRALEAAATEMARLNEQLRRANDELASTNSDLDRFAATVAHDLKNPLAVVAMYTEMLLDPEVGSGTDERALAAIGRATERMRSMINNMLAYSRARSTARHREAVDLSATVRDVAEELAVTSARPFRVTQSGLPTLPVEAGLFRQVLSNVIGNAVKYVEPGSEPHVHVTAHRDSEAAAWTLRVADNGIGIDGEAKEKVFDLFHREAPTTYSGSGVGLSTCRRIVEDHGGRIWIEDNTPRGCVVCISIPDT